MKLFILLPLWARMTLNLGNIAQRQLSKHVNPRHKESRDETDTNDEHAVFSMSNPITYRIGSNEWSEWTCCRYIVNTQSRQRILFGKKIDVQYRRCGSNFCNRSMCVDSTMLCRQIVRTIKGNTCDPKNSVSRVMSHHCPNTCKFCESPHESSLPYRPLRTTPKWRRSPSTPKPSTTKPHPRHPHDERTLPRQRPTSKQPASYRQRTPEQAGDSPNLRPESVERRLADAKSTQASTADSKLVQITIFKHNLNPLIPAFKFVIGDVLHVGPPWTRIGVDAPRISSFRLHERPTGLFRTAIYFCQSRDAYGTEKWKVTKNGCTLGWNHIRTLYGSTRRSNSAVLYFIGTRREPYGTSEISKKIPTAKYRSSIFVLYGPRYKEKNSIQPTHPSYITQTSFVPPGAPSSPLVSSHQFQNPKSKIPIKNQFNKECLEAHNFFRAIHNVPALRWSERLAKSAQSWADQLKVIAPRRPELIEKPRLKTLNWPHSVAGSKFRDVDDGENIAWDYSQDGSPARESILRFYVELFYYSRARPTSSPSRDRPVGHLTQLLWKDTTHVGCARATTVVGAFEKLSTWTVMHYSPGGNHRYRASFKRTVQLYEEQVPEMRRGSCMTRHGSCNMGNQCLAMGPSRGKCICTRGAPICSGKTGCIAWCENKRGAVPWKEECEGMNVCKCTSTGALCQ